MYDKSSYQTWLLVMRAVNDGAQPACPKPSRTKLDITEHYVYLPQCCSVLVLLRPLVGTLPSAPLRGLPVRIEPDFIRTKTAVKKK
jgi:hypothetical protein